MSLAKAAIRYARKRRWKIYPIEPGGFAPVVVSGSVRFDPAHASNNPPLVRRWWEEWPEANIGVNLEASRLVVVRIYNVCGTEDVMKMIETSWPTLSCDCVNRNGDLLNRAYLYSGAQGSIPIVGTRIFFVYDRRLIVPPSRHEACGDVYGDWTLNWPDESAQVAKAPDFPDWLLAS